MTPVPNLTNFPPQRSSWMIVAALGGCFFGAILVGLGLGKLIQPGGDAAAAIVMFALFGVYIGGMALWGSIAASIMAKAIFSGDLLAALLRFFWRRRREDLPKLNLTREAILAAAQRVYGWTRVFVWLAVGVAMLASPLAGLLATRGFLVSSLLTFVVVIAYGAALHALARAGFLVPPDLE